MVAKKRATKKRTRSRKGDTRDPSIGEITFEPLGDIVLPDGKKIRRNRISDQPIDELNCCKIKGYVRGSVEVKALTGKREIDENRTLRNGTNASASALSPNTYDTAADAGSLIETVVRQEQDYIVHIVTYTVHWKFEDWCRSVSVMCDYGGDVSGRQEWLEPHGSFSVTTSTRYEAADFNSRNLRGMAYRFIVVDQTGEMLARQLFINTPPTV